MAKGYLTQLRIAGFILSMLPLPLNLLAQTGPGKPARGIVAPHVKGLPEHAQPKLSWTGAAGGLQKSTAIKSRLVAVAITQPGGASTMIPRDTMNLLYSGGRGGDGTEGNPLMYDTLNWSTWDATAGAYVPDSRYIQTYNAQDRPINFIDHYFFGGVWKPAQLETHTYTVQGPDSVVIYSFWDTTTAAWVPYMRASFSYNASGQLIGSINENRDFYTNILSPVGRETYTYTSAGLVARHEHERWDSSGWVPQYSTEFSYTSSNLLQRYTDLSSNGTSLDSEGTCFYYYNSSDQLIAKRSHNYRLNEDDSSHMSPLSSSGKPIMETGYHLVDTTWVPTSRFSNSYTASDMMSSETWETFDAGSWGYRHRSFYFYNSYDQDSLHYSETFYDGAWTAQFNGDLRVRNYYSLYDTAATTAPSGDDPIVVLSPVPAGDQLMMTLSLKEPSVFSASILDLAGRVRQSWTGTAGTQYRQQISTENLPEGRYFLRVNCNGIRISKTFVVLH